MLITIYSWTYLCFFGALAFWLAIKFGYHTEAVTIGVRQTPSPKDTAQASGAYHVPLWFVLPGIITGLVVVWYLATKTENSYRYLIWGLSVVCCTIFFARVCTFFGLPLESVPVAGLCVILGVIGGLSWTVLPGWLAFNAASLMVAVVIISHWRFNQLRYVFGFLTCIIFYDVWGVFISGMIVELAMATIENPDPWLPAGMVIVVPASFWDITSPVVGNSYSILGMGDIMLSGITVMAAVRYRLADWVFVGFVVGLFITSIVLYTYRVPLPAMLFLSPCLMLFFLLGARWRRVKLAW